MTTRAIAVNRATLTSEANPRAHTVYLQGRDDPPGGHPGNLVLEVAWPGSCYAPPLSSERLARPFQLQVDEIDPLFSCAVAVGFSWGAWLALAAAHQRLARGASIPRLLLLSPVLGRGGSGAAGLGFFAPRSRRIRHALGLDQGSRVFSLSRTTIIRGASDPQCLADDARVLQCLGFTLHTVEDAGHRLDTQAACHAIKTALAAHLTSGEAQDR